MDRAVIEDNLIDWSAAVNRYCDQFGYAAPDVLKWQAGMLARDLIARTPVAIAANIRKDVASTFKALKGNKITLGAKDKKSGRGDVRWYFADSGNLFGVARDQDMTSAGDDAIYREYFKNKKRSGIGQVYVGRRGKQKVYVWKKLTITKEQVKRLADRLVGHAGRLAAGWTVSWAFCGSPGRALPAKVQRHTGPKARGHYIDGLKLPGNPTITIVNTAKGVRQMSDNFINLAILRRVYLMRRHISRLINNPEEAARTVPDEVYGGEY